MVENAKGALFKNERKVPESKQPDWTGSVDVTPDLLQALLREAMQAGVYKARVAAWVRQGPRGTFLSLALEAPFVKGSGTARGTGPQPADVVPLRKPSDPFSDF